LFDLMDMDENGSIDFREFILGMRMLDRNSLIKQKDDISHIKFAFTVYDANGDLKISKEEFSGILSLVYEELDKQSLSEKVDELFDAIDTQKKGEISFDQFKLAVEKNPELITFASKALGDFVEELETPMISKKSPFE
jgi:Ca2+-binding EF-hand superfamily protein